MINQCNERYLGFENCFYMDLLVKPIDKEENAIVIGREIYICTVRPDLNGGHIQDIDTLTGERFNHEHLYLTRLV